jgi:hypothetical protein
LPVFLSSVADVHLPIRRHRLLCHRRMTRPPLPGWFSERIPTRFPVGLRWARRRSLGKPGARLWLTFTTLAARRRRFSRAAPKVLKRLPSDPGLTNFGFTTRVSTSLSLS